MKKLKIEPTAGCVRALYRAGYRSEDKEELMAKYGIGEEDAQEICEMLGDFEEVFG